MQILRYAVHITAFAELGKSETNQQLFHYHVQSKSLMMKMRICCLIFCLYIWDSTFLASRQWFFLTTYKVQGFLLFITLPHLEPSNSNLQERERSKIKNVKRNENCHSMAVYSPSMNLFCSWLTKFISLLEWFFSYFKFII